MNTLKVCIHIATLRRRDRRSSKNGADRRRIVCVHYLRIPADDFVVNSQTLPFFASKVWRRHFFFFFFAAWSETFLPLAAPSGVSCAWRHMGRHLLYQLLLSRFSSIPHGAIRVHTFSISFYCLDFRRLRLAQYGHTSSLSVSTVSIFVDSAWRHMGHTFFINFYCIDFRRLRCLPPRRHMDTPLHSVTREPYDSL